MTELKDMKLFNLWLPSECQEEKGSAQPFLDHCEYILPDTDERNIMLDYLAYIVQHPGQKIHWMILLQGIQGTGKSYFGEVMRLVLGPHNVSNPSNEAVHEPYTGWQKACQLVVIEELMARGRLELMNKLKPMITQDIAVIREMYIPPYEQPNRFNLLGFTNHEDSILIDDHDRRYCVLFSDAVPQGTDYYEDLWAWTSSHAGRVLKLLKKRDLKAFKPKGHAPMTQGKKKLIRTSLPPLTAWVKSCIEDEAWPFHSDLVSTRHLIECVPNNLRNATETAIGRALTNCGAMKQQRVKLSIGGSVQLWSVRRHEMHESSEQAVLLNNYEKWLSDRDPGGNPLADSKPF